MFSEQMSQIQSRLNETLSAAQKRAHELEAEARKIVETLGDRAQTELKVLLAQAQGLSKEQIAQLGTELVKLGTRLQDVAKSWKGTNGKASSADGSPASSRKKHRASPSN
jgi:hypothetical protein